jgi:hypothetical protein
MSKKSARSEPLLSVTALAKLFRVDRGTVARRLEKVTPAQVDSRGKFYRLEDAAPAMARTGDVGPSARQEKTEAEAELLKLRLRREKGEVVPIAEVRDYAVRLFKAMHNRIGQRLPREISAQLYKSGSAAHLEETLAHELGRVFNELREDHTKFLREE